MPGFFIFNGALQNPSDLIVGPANRGLRYGEGLFETMRMENGAIRLEEFHRERLARGMQLLSLDLTTGWENLISNISLCAEKNECSQLARIRLNVFGGDGGHTRTESPVNYTIECEPLNADYLTLNHQGWTLDIFPDAQKSCDIFSALKHNNFLPYLLAARFAKENQLDDALIFNQHGRIADSTIANVFYISDGIITTNTLHEGCIDGVMRRYLIQQFKAAGIPFREQTIEIQELVDAEEIFLTNALAGIRWVGKFQNEEYPNLQTAALYEQFLQ